VNAFLGLRRRARGVSMFETALGCSVLGSLALASGGVLSSTTGLGRRSHADLMACELNRRGLERVSNLMRSAAWSSLAGFNAGGVATAPQFQLVTGFSGGVVSLGSTNTMQWQTGQRCAGVTNPGDIVWIVDGVTQRVAEHVESGGFTVTQSGNSLLIHLVTYAPMDNGEVARVSGDTMVQLRN
jgi:hypothetical protein